MSQQIKSFEDIRQAKLRGARIVDVHGDVVGWDVVTGKPTYLSLTNGHQKAVSGTESDWSIWLSGMIVTEPETTLKSESVPDPLTPPGSNPKARFGATKPSLGLIPASAALYEAMAFEDGARKYGPFNWRKDAPDIMTYMHAMERHMKNFMDGQTYTSDTGVHNLGAVRACCAIIIDAMECNNIIDNRPPPAPSPELQDRLQAEKKAKMAGKP